MAKKQTKTAETKKEDPGVLFGIITYILFIVGLVWYLVDDGIKKNAFAKFHFKQSLVLVIAYIILMVAASILSFVPFLQSIIGLLALVLVIIGIVNVVNKEQKELPIIGAFGKKLTF